MPTRDTNPSDPLLTGLAALGWVLGDTGRAARLLSITGLAPDDLRRRAGDPHLLAATLAFLEAHEPDLVACADAIGREPAELVAARAALER